MKGDGFTLIELLMGMVLIGLLSVVAIPRFAVVRDQLAVERAAQDIATFYFVARHAAILRMRRVRIEFRPDSLRAVYEGTTDSTFLSRPGPTSRGVELTASRPVIRLYPNGIGFGAANTKLVVRRGTAADSLTTSRLGRLKRW